MCERVKVRLSGCKLIVVADAINSFLREQFSGSLICRVRKLIEIMADFHLFIQQGEETKGKNDRKKKQPLIIVLGNSIIFSRIQSEVSENYFQ